MYMKQSLRVVITIFMIVMIAVSASFAVFYSFELYYSTADQIASSSNPTLHAVWTTVSANLDTAEHYLNSIAYDSAIMEDLGSLSDPTHLYAASDTLRNAYSPLLYADSTIAGVIVYDGRTDVTHAVYGHLSGDSGPARIVKKEQIQNTALGMIQDMTLNLREWDFVTVGDSCMIYRAIYWAGTYSICLIDLDAIVQYYTVLYALPGRLALAHDGQWLTVPDEAATDLSQASPINDYASVYRKTNTLVVKKSGEELDLYCFIPLDDLIHQVTTLQRLILIIALCCVVGMVAIFIYLRRQFIQPMNNLMASMERIQKGDLEAQPSERYNTTEFRALNETFNSMVASLRNAKILAYEKDLENQRIRFNTLRLQIRPHFYLNCLKSIYASAALEDTEKVRSQILYLSTHLRYCFSELGQTVPLSKELEMCSNYINMISLNREAPLLLHLDVEDDLKDFPIPPMTVLTAVENSGKYFKTSSTPGNVHLSITISARILRMETSRLVNITIQDNGPGFSEEAIRLITNPTTEHVGISNIVQQLRLYFGPECEVAFTNHNGAQVDFFIPIKEDPHESADR